MAGKLCVQSLPLRLVSVTRPLRMRAPMRQPSNLISWTHSSPRGGSLTSVASCGRYSVAGTESRGQESPNRQRGRAGVDYVLPLQRKSDLHRDVLDDGDVVRG